MDASFWGPMWRELAADVTLLTPEFPGFGAATPTAAPTIADFARQVAELIAEDSGPAIVVGLSLGGYVALALAVEHPQAVAALVLANTRAEADSPETRRAREQALDTVRIDGLDTYLTELVPRLLSPSAERDVWERAYALAETQDADAVCQALEALRDRPDHTGDLAGIEARTIVIGGQDDAVTPHDAVAALASAIPGATLEIIPGAGHLSALERPAEFAAIVARMIPT